MRNILGLDISSKTGAVSLGWCEHDKQIGEYTVLGQGLLHVPTGNKQGKYHPMDRLGMFAQKLLNVLADNGTPELVVIEGYGFSSMQSKAGVVLQVEIGTVMRYFLQQRNIPYIEVPPTNLKKFILGKGVGKKDLIMKEVYKRWGFDTTDDNIADAFGLAMFGSALLGMNTGVQKVNLTALEPVRETLLYQNYLASVT